MAGKKCGLCINQFLSCRYDVTLAFISHLDLKHKKDGYIELRPANKNYKPIRIDEYDDFEVWGVVVWIIKKCH